MCKRLLMCSLAVLCSGGWLRANVSFTYGSMAPLPGWGLGFASGGINNRGQIAVSYGEGTYVALYDISSGNYTYAGCCTVGGISDSGAMVGRIPSYGGPSYGWYSDGSNYSTGDPGTSYNGISSDGTKIVGSSPCYGFNCAGVQSSFVITNGVTTPINVPGATATFATGVNDSGEIVGTYTTSAQSFQCCNDGNTLLGGGGFLFADGTFTLFPSAATAINDRGQIVGAFGFRDSNGVITPLTPTHTEYNSPMGINNADQILFRDGELAQGVSPEPGFYGVLAVGMAGLLFAARLRKSNRPAAE